MLLLSQDELVDVLLCLTRFDILMVAFASRKLRAAIEALPPNRCLLRLNDVVLRKNWDDLWEEPSRMRRIFDRFVLGILQPYELRIYPNSDKLSSVWRHSLFSSKLVATFLSAVRNANVHTVYIDLPTVPKKFKLMFRQSPATSGRIQEFVVNTDCERVPPSVFEALPFLAAEVASLQFSYPMGKKSQLTPSHQSEKLLRNCIDRGVCSLKLMHNETLRIACSLTENPSDINEDTILEFCFAPRCVRVDGSAEVELWLNWINLSPEFLSRFIQASESCDSDHKVKLLLRGANVCQQDMAQFRIHNPSCREYLGHCTWTYEGKYAVRAVRNLQLGFFFVYRSTLSFEEWYLDNMLQLSQDERVDVLLCLTRVNILIVALTSRKLRAAADALPVNSCILRLSEVNLTKERDYRWQWQEPMGLSGRVRITFHRFLRETLRPYNLRICPSSDDLGVVTHRSLYSSKLIRAFLSAIQNSHVHSVLIDLPRIPRKLEQLVRESTNRTGSIQELVVNTDWLRVPPSALEALPLLAAEVASLQLQFYPDPVNWRSQLTPAPQSEKLLRNCIDRGVSSLKLMHIEKLWQIPYAENSSDISEETILEFCFAQRYSRPNAPKLVELRLDWTSLSPQFLSRFIQASEACDSDHKVRLFLRGANIYNQDMSMFRIHEPSGRVSFGDCTWTNEGKYAVRVLPVERDGIRSEMLAPDSDENGSLPLMLTKLRQCLMGWLDNPDNFVIDAFFSSLSAALGDLSFEEYASKATLDKVMRAQRICVVFFDFCRPQLRALYKVPIFGFHFRHFIRIAEQCAKEVPDVPESSVTLSRVEPFAGAPQSNVYGRNVSAVPSMFAGSAQPSPPGSVFGPTSTDFAMTSPHTYEAATWCELQPTTSQQASYAGCPPPHLNDGSALHTAQLSAYPGLCYSWQNGDVHDLSE